MELLAKVSGQMRRLDLKDEPTQARILAVDSPAALKALFATACSEWTTGRMEVSERPGAMKVTKVSADVFDQPSKRRQLTPRQLARRELEGALERAARDAHTDKAAAFRLRLDDGEKPATLRLAFNRVKRRAGFTDVNLFKVGDDLFIAAREQRRGRRPKGA